MANRSSQLTIMKLVLQFHTYNYNLQLLCNFFNIAGIQHLPESHLASFSTAVGRCLTRGFGWRRCRWAAQHMLTWEVATGYSGPFLGRGPHFLWLLGPCQMSVSRKNVALYRIYGFQQEWFWFCFLEKFDHVLFGYVWERMVPGSENSV